MERAFSHDGASHAPPRRMRYGCVGISRRDGAPCVLLTRLRWTRSGFQRLFAVMCGEEPPSSTADALRNCTDEELGLFYFSPSSDEAFHKVWEQVYVPDEWRHARLPTALVNYRTVVYDRAREESERRRSGQMAPVDTLSRNPWVLPLSEKGAVNGPLSADDSYLVSLRAFCNESGIPESHVKRVCTASGQPLDALQYRDLTCYVVTVSSPEWLERDEWKVITPATSLARWFRLDEASALWFMSSMRMVLYRVMHNMDAWLQYTGVDPPS